MSHRIEAVPFAGREGVDPGDEVFLELPGANGAMARMVFCWCPKPEQPFQMGSPESEDGRGDNERRHWVTLSHGFWMAKHPVNQGQYRALRGDHKSRFGSDERWPVDTVPWEDGQAYCHAANARLKIGGGWRLALPAEAQWEYACRAGGPSDAPFAIGDSHNLHAQWVNFDGNHPYGDGWKWMYREATLREGAFPPNAWGLHDLHGQLYEWCEDAYGQYPETEESNPVRDPGALATAPDEGGSWLGRLKRSVLPQVNPATVAYRVLRGGCWGNLGGGCRAADRFGIAPALWSGNVGFRPVLAPS